MDLVSSVKDDGLDPRLDSFTADFNDFLNRNPASSTGLNHHCLH